MKNYEALKEKAKFWLREAELASFEGNCAFELANFRRLAKECGATYQDLNTSYKELAKFERRGFRNEAAEAFADAKNATLQGRQMCWYDFSRIEQLRQMAKVSYKAIGTTKEEFERLRQENDRRFGKG